MAQEVKVEAWGNTCPVAIFDEDAEHEAIEHAKYKIKARLANAKLKPISDITFRVYEKNGAYTAHASVRAIR